MQIPLNDFSSARSFRSREDFSRYAEGQAEKFQELQKSDPSAFSGWGKQLSNWWNQAKANSDRADLSDDQFLRQMRKIHCVPFQSGTVKLLRRNSSSGNTQRVNGVLRFIDGSQDSNSVPLGTSIGAAEAASLVAVVEQLSKPSTKKMLSGMLDEHESDLSDLLKKDEAELAAQRKSFGALEESFKETFDNNRLDFGVFLGKSKEEWLETHNRFIEQLKTETAVKLWDSRATAHKEAYMKFRAAAVWSGVVGGLLAIGWIFGGISLAGYIFKSNETAQISSYAAGSIVVFTLLVWLLRVLVRSMLSENHLSTDASVRSAMAHTYLALTKEDKASNEDRAIILASLFAPVSDGLVSDDGMPVLSPAALAASALTNPKT